MRAMVRPARRARWREWQPVSSKSLETHALDLPLVAGTARADRGPAAAHGTLSVQGCHLVPPREGGDGGAARSRDLQVLDVDLDGPRVHEFLAHGCFLRALECRPDPLQRP